MDRGNDERVRATGPLRLHRWEDEAYPDPTGTQLLQLRTLQDCFIVYDYCSFPSCPARGRSRPTSRRSWCDGPAHLRRRRPRRARLPHPRMVRVRVVRLVAAQLHGVRRGTRRAVRDAARLGERTTATALTSGRANRSSENFIDRRVLHAINDVLPIYWEAQFQNEYDRDVVTRLLIDHLGREAAADQGQQLFRRMEDGIRWTDERLAPSFAGEGEVPKLDSGVPIRRFRTSVPATLKEAVNGRYEIKRYGSLARLNPLDGLSRASFRRE